MRQLLLSALLLLCFVSLAAQEKQKVIIDADTGNEVDDLYAIVRGLIEPTWDVVALNATQWQPAHWAVEQSMEESYRLNQVLLSYLELGGQVKSLRGGTNRLFDWGNRAQPSLASHNLIQEAHKMPAGEQLTVIALGALTNVASALLMDSTITPKIKLYWLGSTYDFDEGILRKRDFNCMMDPQALEEILQSEVELHIIPVNIAAQMTFTYQESKEKLAGKHDLLDFLLERWYNHLDGGRAERTIWDLAIIDAVIHPDWVEEVKITSSKENYSRPIHYIKDIEEDKMRSEFFEKVLAHLTKR